MNREEYILTIKRELGFLPYDEIKKAEEYFNSFFTGSESDEGVISRLGNPASAAKHYCETKMQKEPPKEAPKTPVKTRSYTGIIIAVIVAVFALPVWLPALLILAVIVFGIITAAIAVSFGSWIGGGAVILSGILNHAILADKLIQCGLGFLMLAAGILLSWLLICAMISLCIWIIRKITD